MYKYKYYKIYRVTLKFGLKLKIIYLEYYVSFNKISIVNINKVLPNIKMLQEESFYIYPPKTCFNFWPNNL